MFNVFRVLDLTVNSARWHWFWQANLWDIDVAPTMVMTQRGARKEFQEKLRAMGVEVIEFDFLNPGVATDYLAKRGCLQLFWECGGMLAAPAVSDRVIHKVKQYKMLATVIL